MFLRIKTSRDLIRVVDVDALLNPLCEFALGHAQSGEEEQEVESYSKRLLEFPSGEPLPDCWLDVQYRAQFDCLKRRTLRAIPLP